MCFDYGRCDRKLLTKKALVAFCPRGKSEFDRVAPKGDPDVVARFDDFFRARCPRGVTGWKPVLHRSCLPGHEVIQRLAGPRGYELHNGRIIHKAEKRGLVGNQIKWVDQIIESSNDPQKRVF